jgi:RNase adaptor protein for sRNA GlmZ degradation
MDVQIVSFGHRYLSGRWEQLNGFHKAVVKEVMSTTRAQILVARLTKSVVNGDTNKVAFGCKAGRHRSVALAEVLAASLRAQGVNVTVEHREQHRWQA